MDFTLLNAVRNHPADPYPLPDVYADYIGDAVLAEELGFTGSWYGEHHFRDCQWSGSPILVATAVAAATQRLRVGTAVSLLPFHDPRRLAEDVATADIISRGRFDFGIGPGSQYEEFQIFGVDPAEMNGRMWESVDWIQRAFTEKDQFTHDGRYYSIPDMTFTTTRIRVTTMPYGPPDGTPPTTRSP
jgi:alkanesulfonate monooxygenase SsuD/methylene tetrahydromethanopterin reductase-like flavin-dependent oxidoreductase (luciferase family)